MSNKQEQEQYRCKVEVKHEFTPAEWKDKTSTLTRKMKQLEQLEMDVKAAAAVAKSRIKEVKAEVMTLANSVDDGYEMQNVEAVQRFNRKKGSKKLYHWCPGNKELDGKLIREEPMTEDDFKLLPLGDPDLAPGQGQPDGTVKDGRRGKAAEPAEPESGEEAGGEENGGGEAPY